MIQVYTKPNCPACAQAKIMLMERGILFEEIEVNEQTRDHVARSFPGFRTVPIISIPGQPPMTKDRLVEYLAGETSGTAQLLVEGGK